jgi:hypothetical protein
MATAAERPVNARQEAIGPRAAGTALCGQLMYPIASRLCPRGPASGDEKNKNNLHRARTT